MSENRFLIIHHEETKNKTTTHPQKSFIIKDIETGALYYQVINGASRMAVTPLIGPDGKNMVEAVD